MGRYRCSLFLAYQPFGIRTVEVSGADAVVLNIPRTHEDRRTIRRSSIQHLSNGYWDTPTNQDHFFDSRNSANEERKRKNQPMSFNPSGKKFCGRSKPKRPVVKAPLRISSNKPKTKQIPLLANNSVLEPNFDPKSSSEFSVI